MVIDQSIPHLELKDYHPLPHEAYLKEQQPSIPAGWLKKLLIYKNKKNCKANRIKI